jgi:hypothetical protein
VIQGQRYGVPDEGHQDSRETKDKRKYELREFVAATNGQFVYHYDLGDDWHHTLEIEKTLPRKRVYVTPFAW